ncbi:MAG: arginyltransferase [Planctomycetes bacterium]|nr:arginyltransferase [Planctomycetota bacterium]
MARDEDGQHDDMPTPEGGTPDTGAAPRAIEPQTRVRPSLSVLHTLPTQPTHPCPYRPGFIARDRGFAVGAIDPIIWQHLLDDGWRRSGTLIYEPACLVCNDCRSIRIPAHRFHLSRSQRRVVKRNRDVEVTITDVQVTDERAELYQRYITTRHDGLMTGTRRELERFLGATCVDTFEIEYRLNNRLLAVGSTDRLPNGLSCVYCYFDPDEPGRSLGTLNILHTIDLCRTQRAGREPAWVYLGYWVEGSKTMGYKSRFRPHEIRPPDGSWVPQTDSRR